MSFNLNPKSQKWIETIKYDRRKEGFSQNDLQQAVNLKIAPSDGLFEINYTLIFFGLDLLVFQFRLRPSGQDFNLHEFHEYSNEFVLTNS